MSMGWTGGDMLGNLAGAGAHRRGWLRGSGGAVWCGGSPLRRLCSGDPRWPAMSPTAPRRQVEG
jgi:hypothetical protein